MSLSSRTPSILPMPRHMIRMKKVWAISSYTHTSYPQTLTCESNKLQHIFQQKANRGKTHTKGLMRVSQGKVEGLFFSSPGERKSSLVARGWRFWTLEQVKQIDSSSLAPTHSKHRNGAGQPQWSSLLWRFIDFVPHDGQSFLLLRKNHMPIICQSNGISYCWWFRNPIPNHPEWC